MFEDWFKQSGRFLAGNRWKQMMVLEEKQSNPVCAEPFRNLIWTKSGLKLANFWMKSGTIGPDFQISYLDSLRNISVCFQKVLRFDPQPSCRADQQHEAAFRANTGSWQLVRSFSAETTVQATLVLKRLSQSSWWSGAWTWPLNTGLGPCTHTQTLLHQVSRSLRNHISSYCFSSVFCRHHHHHYAFLPHLIIPRNHAFFACHRKH